MLLDLFTLFSVCGTQSLYNDFYNTMYTNAYELIKHRESESLSYGEFYSEKLFDRIKKKPDTAENIQLHMVSIQLYYLMMA
ncbi:hypothetical protein SAMN02910342_02738 [Butyrivibrio sp. INlla21]|nr:hypothetical protein SAMN02910342_02738 [Butyrivibrio sp. INlla21]